MIIQLAVLSRPYARPIGAHLQLLPVAAIKHEAVVTETEISSRHPTGLGRSIKVPFAGVAGGISIALQYLGKGDHATLKWLIITDRTRVLWIEP